MLSFLERKGRAVRYSDTDTQRNLSPVPLLNRSDCLSFTHLLELQTIRNQITKQPHDRYRCRRSDSSNHYVLTGATFTRSRAVMGYLVNQYGKDDSLYPTNPKKRAVVDQRLYFDAGTLQQRNADYSVRVARIWITLFLG
jgi:hypothetical protein